MRSTSPHFDEVVSWFTDPKPTGHGVMARCPAHNDDRRSLHISLGSDDRILMKCHANCKTADVLDQVGKSFRDLYPYDKWSSIRGRGREQHAIVTYDYTDEQGNLLYQAVRKQFADHKEFFQQKPDGRGKWERSLGDVRRVLYRLPDLVTARMLGFPSPVFIAEGEKDVDALRGLGFIATTNAGGAGKWRDEYNRTLIGAPVVLVPDNDTPGYSHMLKVARSLAGKAKSVRLVRLTEIGPKGDLSDYLANAGDRAERDLAALGMAETNIAPGLEVISLDELARLAEPAQPEGPDSSNGGTADPIDELLRRFLTAHQIRDSTPEQPDWITDFYVAGGAITEIDGQPKVGKSQLVADLVCCAVTGRPFLGNPTKKTPVVYLTEQSPATFRALLARVGLLDCSDLVVLTWSATQGYEWPDVVEAAVRKAKEIGAQLLVIDTLPQFANLRGDSENNAGAALEAIKPVQYAASQGLAIVVIRHERKGGGEPGESARGSSAFAGAVDVIVQLRRQEGNQRETIRVLKSLSRFDDTPASLVVEWTENGFVSLGTEQAHEGTRVRKLVLDLLPASKEIAKSIDEIVELLNSSDGAKVVKRSTVADALKSLVESEVVGRTGKGAKGSPFAFWVHGASDIVPSDSSIGHRVGVPINRNNPTRETLVIEAPDSLIGTPTLIPINRNHPATSVEGAISGQPTRIHVPGTEARDVARI